jgi:hypothetical protein
LGGRFNRSDALSLITCTCGHLQGLAVRYLGGSAGARPARGEFSEHNGEERSVLDTSIVRRKEHAHALFSQRPVPNQRTIRHHGRTITSPRGSIQRHSPCRSPLPYPPDHGQKSGTMAAEAQGGHPCPSTVLFRDTLHASTIQPATQSAHTGART